MSVLGVIDGHREYLMISLSTIEHCHHADSASVDERQRCHRFLTQNQHIQRIVIFRIRLGNESIIGRVMDRRVQDPVYPEQTS